MTGVKLVWVYVEINVGEESWHLGVGFLSTSNFSPPDVVVTLYFTEIKCYSIVGLCPDSVLHCKA